MLAGTLDSLARKIDTFDTDLPVERAWMPPSSWYTDPGLFALERRAVFHRTWQPVARVDQLAEPGSYIAGRLPGMPWVVTRDADGRLAAFHNACRHKAREVVTGQGRADALVCGYHAWRYGLDGALRSAPKLAGIEDFDRGAMSLVPLGVEIWGPWIFVNGDAEAAPLSRSLAGLTESLDRGGWADLTFVESVSWEFRCNWKVYIDNYLDGGYHIPHMHPTLDAQLHMPTYRTEVFEAFSVQTCDPAGEADERIDYDAAARIGDGAIYAWTYPNFMLNRYGPCLDTNYVVPVAPDRCRVLYDFFFLETEGTAARDFIRESVAQAAVTQREDIAICESVQVGLESPSYDRGRYAPRLEHGEHHFHRLLAGDLRAELARMRA